MHVVFDIICTRCHLCGCRRPGEVAQLVEQRTHKPWVEGSSPSFATILRSVGSMGKTSRESGFFYFGNVAMSGTVLSAFQPPPMTSRRALWRCETGLLKKLVWTSAILDESGVSVVIEFAASYGKAKEKAHREDRNDCCGHDTHLL